MHFSKSLKDNSSYEFIGPKLADIKTLFARKDWPGLIKLINGPDRSPPGTVTVYSEEIKQAISRLRDWSFFFLLKTTYKLPPTQYDRPASESKCYHFFYVAVPLPTEKDEDLLVQDPPFEYYFYGKQPPLTPGWELHPDGKGIMMEWSPRYSDIFIYVGVDDELWKNPNSIHRRLINLSSKYSEALNKLNVRVREIGDMNNSQRNQKILELREQIKETLSNMLETE